jgi:hypothetical protein
MADVFSLAPEGQAWADDRADNNPARLEDYEPTLFQGSIAAQLAVWQKVRLVLLNPPLVLVSD